MTRHKFSLLDAMNAAREFVTAFEGVPCTLVGVDLWRGLWNIIVRTDLWRYSILVDPKTCEIENYHREA